MIDRLNGPSDSRMPRAFSQPSAVSNSSRINAAVRARDQAQVLGGTLTIGQGDNGGGNFTAAKLTSFQFSDLDLYLMGLMDPNEVSSQFLVTDAAKIDAAASAQSPCIGLGTLNANQYQTVNASNIIAAQARASDLAKVRRAGGMTEEQRVLSSPRLFVGVCDRIREGL